MKKKLHILNGDSTLAIFSQAGIEGDHIVFREMLCQGQCKEPILSPAFWQERKDFFKTHYEVPESEYEEMTQNEISRIEDYMDDREICLWFEYDLFCHVNMFSIISYLDSQKKRDNVYMICSGRNYGDTELKDLGQLDTKLYNKLYADKRLLSKIDFEFANYFWMIYQSDKHNELYSFTFHEHPTFEYLKDCMIAHFYRYPNKDTGLNYSQNIVLEMLNDGPKTKRKIINQLIETQGFYGFGDLQYFKIIKDMAPLYTEDAGLLRINENGMDVLKGKKNLSEFVTVKFMVGGTRFTDFYFEKNRIYRLKS